MKIAFIVNGFPLLSETFVLNQITGLLDRGHAVEVFAHQQGPTDKVHPDVHRYRILEKSHVFSRSASPFGLIASLAPVLPQQLLAHPRRMIDTLSRSDGGQKRGKLLAAAALLTRQGPFDVLHCHFGPNGLFGAYLKHLGVSGKLVTTFHGYDMTSYTQRRGVNVYRPLFDAGDLFLPISEKWRQRLESLGCAADKVKVHRMGVDPDKFEFVHRQRDGRRFRLVSVARLVEKKGIDIGIQAVARFKKQHPDVAIEYLIAGDGPLRQQLTEMVAALGCEASIRLLGWQDHDEVERLMNSAHVLLAPSVTGSDGDQEGIPVVLMEALAKGLIVCATAHGCIAELVLPGQTGYLVPEGDIEALRRTLGQIYAQSDVWPEICRRGRNKVVAEYNIHRLNDLLAGHFDTIL